MRVTRAVLALACVLVLSACRLDVVVDVEMGPDGTGTVTLVATADAGLVAEAPDLIDDLSLDDAVDNGWSIDGPTPTGDGGVRITLIRPFSSAAELANVLTSIGPPLTQMAAARTEGDDGQVVNGINGVMVLPDGFASFADADLIAVVGGVPFEDELAATGVAVGEAFSFTYRVSLPGELESAETGTDVGDGVIQWVAPTDGSSVPLYVATVQRPAGSGSSWAGPVSTVSLIALVVWTITAGGFIVFVAFARRARRRRRETRLRHLGRR